MKARILMVAPQPFFRARGTPFSVLHRIRALCSAGHQVDLVTYPFGEDFIVDGLKIYRARRPPLIRDVRIGPSFAKLILDVALYFKTRELLNRSTYDLIHSHEEAAFFCGALARKYGLKHVYDMHSSLPQQLDTFGSYNIGPIRSIFRRLEARVLSTCDGVITICDDLALTAEPFCGAKPHAMIENTADDREAFVPGKIEIRRDLGLEHKKVVLYTGTFESYQGLDILVGALERLVPEVPDIHLLMVGGSKEQIERLRREIADRELTESVTFTGTVPPKDIPSYHDAADLIVSPRSSGTNSPLKLYGYMRSHKPLVATNLYTHTQVLDETVACLVPPTPAGIASGISRVISDPQYARQISDNAMTRAASEYSDQAYIGRVLGFYDSVIQADRRPSARSSPTHSPAD